jgi:hypothetical protein
MVIRSVNTKPVVVPAFSPPAPDGASGKVSTQKSSGQTSAGTSSFEAPIRRSIADPRSQETIRQLQSNQHVRSLVSGHQAAVQLQAARPKVSAEGARVAKDSKLDVAKYSDADLRGFDVIPDGQLDENEIVGILQFADVGGDGEISGDEQLALDFLAGKDLSTKALEAFLAVHGDGALEGRAQGMQRGASEAAATAQKMDKAHDALLNEVDAQEKAMRDHMNDDGIIFHDDAPKRVKEEIKQLEANKRSTPDYDKKRNALDARLAYAEMRAENKARIQVSFEKRQLSKVLSDNVQVENRVAQKLYKTALERMGPAQRDAVRGQSQQLVGRMTQLKEQLQSNGKVHEDFKTFSKTSAIANAVRDGKLARKDVDMKKVEADVAASKKVVKAHTNATENTALEITKTLTDPAFNARLEALPEDERADVLTRMHGAIADTDVGKEFFRSHVYPSLSGDGPVKPDWYDPIKKSRQGTKLAINLFGVWGLRLAEKGGKDASKLLDNALGRALGVSGGKLDVVSTAVQAMYAKENEVLKLLSKPGGPGAEAVKSLAKSLGKDVSDIQAAIQKGETAALSALAKEAGVKVGADLLKADKDLSGLVKNFDSIGRVVSVMTSVLAVSDMLKDPSVRTALSGAKGMSEIAEVLSKMGKNGVFKSSSKFVGKFGPPLDMVMGSMDAYEAAKRGDKAAFYGGVAQMTGGAMGTVALAAVALGATGVGAPLALVGGAVAALGSLVVTLWGDSPTEKWLRANAPEYVK